MEHFNEIAVQILVWAVPVLIAITFHEAAHGFVAWRLGDDTAKRLGRVTFNPIRHVDPVGTVALPVMLLIVGSPFLIGYAKPVPVDFRRLNDPRRDMMLVAAAGPAINIALAIVSGLLAHLFWYVPAGAQVFMLNMLRASITINVILAIFNLIPVPPLDGGRIAVGLLPRPLAMRLAKVEPYGFFIILGLVIMLPFLGREFGLAVDPFRAAFLPVVQAVMSAIFWLTGHG